MKTPLRLLALLAGLLSIGSAARASHTMGGQLTYEYIGTPAQPNLYRITCLVTRHCSGIVMAPPSVSCRVGTPSTACTSSDPRNTTVVMSLASSAVSEFNCPSTGNLCSSTSTPTAFSTDRYTGTVELPPAPSWTLSMQEVSRSATGNIIGGSNLYLETTLSNQLTLPDGSTLTLRDNSPLVPEQTPLVYPAILVQLNSMNFTAYDADGDSLAYRLERPLDGCNQPLVYKPIPPNSPIILSQNPPCVAASVGFPTMYSASFPILSYQLSGTCPVKTAGPFFTFNPRQGSFTFRPAIYSSTTPADNQYVVVGSITEYRKVGGRYYAIGTVRRDMLVAVGDGANNQMPSSPVASGSTASNTAGTDSLVVEASAQTPATASFQFSDLDAGQQLTLSLALPNDALYPGLYANPAAPDVPVSISGNGTATPTLQVRLRPSIMGRTYRIPLRVEDNACPVKGVYHYVLVLRATNRPTATPTHAARSTAVLSAFPNPFTEQVSFTVPRPAGTARLAVTDALGREVAQLPVPAGPTPEVQLTWTPAPTTPPGVYLVRLPDTGQTLRLLRR